MQDRDYQRLGGCLMLLMFALVILVSLFFIWYGIREFNGRQARLEHAQATLGIGGTR